MKLATRFGWQNQVHGIGWEAYDEDDLSLCSFGVTEHEAIINFVRYVLLRYDIQADEFMAGARFETCDRCGERPPTHTVAVRDEVLSDEWGTVWGYSQEWWCDECDSESEPDWDATREEREERRLDDERL